MIPDDVSKPDDIDYVILKDITLEDRNMYLVTRDLEERVARKSGVSTEGELMQQARKGGFWGEDEDDIEARADDHIAFLKAEFQAKAKFRSRQNIIKVQLADAEAKKEYVQNKRNQLKQMSAEYLAHEIASFSLLRRIAFKPDNTPLIPDDETFMFLKEEYLIFLYFLIQEMMNEGFMEVSDLREIARSTEWRLVWVLSRENLPAIFGRPVSDLTLNHKMLIYWSRVYDSAFETHEPPEDHVIQDDDLFDEWLADRDLERRDRGSNLNKSSTSDHQEQGAMLDGEYVEKCICGAKRANAGKGLGERLPHADNCLYGTWHQFTAAEKEERARRIYKRNSTRVREVLDREQDQVLNKGMVEEQNLRGKKTRSMLGMPTKVIKIQ